MHSQLRTSILVSISILALANYSPGIIFFNVFMEQLHGRTVIMVYGDDKQYCWLKKFGSCLFYWVGKLAS